jgi:hypothetical protein
LKNPPFQILNSGRKKTGKTRQIRLFSAFSADHIAYCSGCYSQNQPSNKGTETTQNHVTKGPFHPSIGGGLKKIKMDGIIKLTT